MTTDSFARTNREAEMSCQGKKNLTAKKAHFMINIEKTKISL